jgi:hypothetical protein
MSSHHETLDVSVKVVAAVAAVAAAGIQAAPETVSEMSHGQRHRCASPIVMDLAAMAAMAAAEVVAASPCSRFC